MVTSQGRKDDTKVKKILSQNLRSDFKQYVSQYKFKWGQYIGKDTEEGLYDFANFTWEADESDFPEEYSKGNLSNKGHYLYNQQVIQPDAIYYIVEFQYI